MRLAALGIALWLALAGGILAEVRTVTVIGEGQISAAPDQAMITVGATHRAKSAEVAMREVNGAVNAMLDALTAAGVAPADMQTSGLSLHAVYDHNRKNNDGPVLLGFNAGNRLNIRVRDLPGVGEVLGTLVKVGANDIGGITFGLQDPKPQRENARKAAVADALEKAALYAEAAGVKLGEVMTIRETGSASPAPEMMRASMASFDAVPVAAGELTITARIEMVLELTD